VEITSNHITRPKVLLFDVYETLLDMSDIENRVNRMLDSKRGYIIWFELFMEYCFVDNCLNRFSDFNAIASATLQMAGKMLHKNLSQDEADEVLDLLTQAPLHEGMHEGFSDLLNQDFRLATLTNSSEKIIRERMERTGLISYFEMVLSAEHVKKYKPCSEVYEWAAKQLKVNLNEILLITSHSWDIAGGANAGMLTAWLKRQNQMLNPLAPKPDIVCENLVDLVSQLSNLPQANGNGQSALNAGPDRTVEIA
jgi:2-haloacid dehalogenase